jgi:apyrase
MGQLLMSCSALQLCALSTFAPCAVGAFWGIVLDMGSSGTRARIHTWDENVPLTEFKPEEEVDADALEISPGIATMRPQDIDGYLRPLLTQAERWVPADEAPTTRIRAFATAGMRALVSSEQEAIWAAVRAVLGDHEASPFLFAPADATTISGNLEGLFGFLAVNFILDLASTDGASEQSVGAMDLGGASVELAFAPDGGAPIMADAYRATIDERTIQVYSHSYMRSGQDVALTRLAEQLLQMHGGFADTPLPNPCLSVGYLDNRTIDGASVQFVGSGEYDQCFELMSRLLHPDYECLQQPCAAMGVYQPALPSGRHTLVAYSAFFYTVEGIGLLGWNEASGVDGVDDITPTMIKDAGRRFCARPWPDVKSTYAHAYCFSSAYIPAMLETFGVGPDSDQIMFSRKLHGYSVRSHLSLCRGQSLVLEKCPRIRVCVHNTDLIL